MGIGELTGSFGLRYLHWYPNYNVAVGINQGEQLFAVRSNQAALHQSTCATLVSILGQASADRYANHTIIDMYPDEANYPVLWVFLSGSGHSEILSMWT